MSAKLDKLEPAEHIQTAVKGGQNLFIKDSTC